MLKRTSLHRPLEAQILEQGLCLIGRISIGFGMDVNAVSAFRLQGSVFTLRRVLTLLESWSE